MEEQIEGERWNSRRKSPCLSVDRSKGSDVYIKGSFKTEKWEDRDENKDMPRKRWHCGEITKVIGSKLIMLGDRKKPVLSEVERKEGREPGDEDDAPF